jgi:hypothetical protein
LPDLVELKETAGDRLEVLLVASDSPAEIKAYLAGEGITMRAVFDRGSASSAFGVDTIPYTVVIDKEGLIRGDYIGGIRWADVDPWL